MAAIAADALAEGNLLKEANLIGLFRKLLITKGERRAIGADAYANDRLENLAGGVDAVVADLQW
jgi:hypothetical protein